MSLNTKNITTDVAALTALRSITGVYRNNQLLQLNRLAIQNGFDSVQKSRNLYEDTAATIFTEDFADLTAWVMPETPGLQVSGNNCYSTGTGGGGSGANHSYVLAANENLRFISKITKVANIVSGGIFIGVSKDAAGAIPAAAAGNVFGLYITESGCKKWDGAYVGEFTAMSAGDYIVSVIVDALYISISIVKTDGSVEAYYRRLRAGFAVNNIYIFNSDNRGLTGCYLSKISARKGLQTITPRTFSEGNKTIQHTGRDGNSFSIYIPSNYDSRMPNPLAICFHGNGTDETAWTSNANMYLLQKALIAAGYIVLGVSNDANRTTWGNTVSTDAYYDAYLYMIDNYAIGNIVFYGNSMGCIESLNAIVESRIPCNALALTSPAFSLIDNYNNLFTDNIKTAYGIAADGSDYAAKTAGRDPSLLPAIQFNGVPIWMAAATDDTSVYKAANADALYSLVNGYSVDLIKIDVSSGGHSFDLTPYLSAIVAFFAKYI